MQSTSTASNLKRNSSKSPSATTHIKRAQVSSSCDFTTDATPSIITEFNQQTGLEGQYTTVVQKNEQSNLQKTSQPQVDCSSSQQSSWINMKNLKEAIRKSSNSARGSHQSSSNKAHMSSKEKAKKSISRPSSGMGGGAYGQISRDQCSSSLKKSLPSTQQRSAYNTINQKHMTASTHRDSLLYPRKQRQSQYSSGNSINGIGKKAYQSASEAGIIIDSSKTSRTVHNPRDLLLLPAVVDSSNELSQSTFMENNQSEIQAERHKRNSSHEYYSDEQMPPHQNQRDIIDQGHSQQSRNQMNDAKAQMLPSNFNSNPYSIATYNNNNHTDTPSSIIIPEEYRLSNITRGREIESILKSEIVLNMQNEMVPTDAQFEQLRLSEIHNIRFEPDQLLTASPYGQTQELDLQNLRNDEENITINQILQSQSDEDPRQQATYRVQNAINIDYKDEFPSYLLQSSDEKQSSEILMQNFVESASQSLCDVSASNQFKRMKNHQPSQSRDSLSSTRKSVLAALNSQNDVLMGNIKIQNQSIQEKNEEGMLNQKQMRQISNEQKQNQCLAQSTHRGSKHQGKFDVSFENKENNNHQANQQQSITLMSNLISNQEVPAITLRVLNKDKAVGNQLDSSGTQLNEKSFKRKNQFKSVERFQDNNSNLSNHSQRNSKHPDKVNNNTLELSVSQTFQYSPYQMKEQKQGIDDAEVEFNKNEIDLLESKEQLQQSPGPDLEMTMQQSFKRNRPSKSSNAAAQGRTEPNPLRRQQQRQQQLYTSNNSHIQHKSINLTLCQKQESSNLKNGFATQIADLSQIEQQSSIDMDLSMQLNPIQDEINQIQINQKSELLKLKKENAKLTRELETSARLHKEEIKRINQENQDNIALRMREIEEENQIIIDGIKQEHNDLIYCLKDQQKRELDQLKSNHERELADKDEKISRKREKIYKLRDQFDSKRKEYNSILIELEAYKNKVEEMTQYQLQNHVTASERANLLISANRNLQTSHSCDNFKTSRQVNQISYFSSREDDQHSLLSNKNTLVKDSNVKEPTPYQSCEEYLEPHFKALQDQQSELREAIKQVNSNLNYESVNSSLYSSGKLGQTNLITNCAVNALANLPNDEMMSYYFSLSQNQNQKPQTQQLVGAYQNLPQQFSEQDSAMNFSFSEVKTSIDNKGSFFEKANGLGQQPFQGGLVQKNSSDLQQKTEMSKFAITQLDKITQENESEENQYSEEKDKIVLMKRKPRSYVTSAVQEDSCFNYSPKMGSINFAHDESLSLHTARDCETLRENQIKEQYQFNYSQDNCLAQHSKNHSKSQSIYNSALMHLESHKSQGLSTSSIDNSKILVSEHVEDEPALENCPDDEEYYQETEVQEPHETSEEEDQKSNLSHKLENMNASMNMSLAVDIQNQNSVDNSLVSQEQEPKGYRMNRNIIYQIDEDLQSRDPSKSSPEGSENAPEDSGFLSEDGEGQERIVNESSLCNEEQNDEYYYNQAYSFNQIHQDNEQNPQTVFTQNQLNQGYEIFLQEQIKQEEQNIILTGRSESAMDEQDDEIEGISKCKAINSSYINLKRNNLLQLFGHK